MIAFFIIASAYLLVGVAIFIEGVRRYVRSRRCTY
jgi:hypothetical protein